MKTVRSQKPLSPDQLLQRLLNADYKQSQCEDEGTRIRKEKGILMELIEQYKQEILVKSEAMAQLEATMEIRAKLRLQLEGLMNERRIFDRDTAHEILKLKQTPIQIRMAGGNAEELSQLRDKNCKLQVRLHQMMDYIAKLEKRVELNEITNHLSNRQEQNYCLEQYPDLDWRQKIKRIKIEEEMHSQQLHQEVEDNRYKLKSRLGSRTTNLFRCL